MSYSDLKGKTFIITGAASGQGRTTALFLARQGANLGLLDLRKPDNVLEEVERIGTKALSFSCNVQSSSAVEAAVRETSERFGGIHGAANMVRKFSKSLLFDLKTLLACVGSTGLLL